MKPKKKELTPTQQKSFDMKKRMLVELEKSKGMINVAARAAGVDPRSHYNWIAKDEKYKEKFEQILEYWLDIVEGKLFELIEVGHLPAIQFYLGTKGRKRGYTKEPQNKEIESEQPQTIQIEIVHGSPTNEAKDNESV